MFRIKRRISFLFSRGSFFFKILRFANLIVFHWDGRMRTIHPGKEDPDITYYKIRCGSNNEGLLSLYFYAMSNVMWARKMGFIPYIDFSDEHCQYYTNRSINGTINAWEYYFTQPVSHLNREELNKKQNVLLSGWTFKPLDSGFRKDLSTVHSLMKDEIFKIQPYVYQIAEDCYSKEFNGKVLGVFIRGTDYVKLKPTADYIQPSIEEVIDKVDEFLTLHKIGRIFLVTEDGNYYKKLKNKFGDMLFSSSYDFIENCEKKDYVSESFNNDPYERGLNYLIKLILLAKCDYLVSSIASGSLFSYGIKRDEYEDSFWFNLGHYK